MRKVWLRYFDVYRKNLFYGLLTTFCEPLLYLLSFGFGLGAMIGDVEIGGQMITYRKFILAGIVAQTVMFQGFFEGAYGGFVRMYYQKIFKAIATTPVTLNEVLWGELIWDGCKGTFAAGIVLSIGYGIGDFSLEGALAVFPICFLFSLLFAALGLLTASLAQSIEQVSYPQYLVIFPMFLFCGVYFPIERLPPFVQTIAWFLPLTSVISFVRSLTLGLPFQIKTIPLILFWLAFFVFASLRFMRKRLIK